MTTSSTAINGIALLLRQGADDSTYTHVKIGRKATVGVLTDKLAPAFSEGVHMLGYRTRGLWGAFQALAIIVLATVIGALFAGVLPWELFEAPVFVSKGILLGAAVALALELVLLRKSSGPDSLLGRSAVFLPVVLSLVFVLGTRGASRVANLFAVVGIALGYSAVELVLSVPRDA
jgi:hypothetical protein